MEHLDLASPGASGVTSSALELCRYFTEAKKAAWGFDAALGEAEL